MSKRSSALNVIVLCAGVVGATPAFSNTYTLNFAGLNGDSQEQVLNYYNGGLGGLGSGPGPSDGITFGSGAVACSVNSCNTALIPGGAGANALLLLSGTKPDAVMDVSAGFTTNLSFYYSEPFFPGGSVTVWSGLNGTGTMLASLSLPNTPDSGTGCGGADYCPYVSESLAFSGTAESVDFGANANGILFADMTLGASSGVPGPIAGAGLPGLVVACGGLLLAWRRRRRIADV